MGLIVQAADTFVERQSTFIDLANPIFVCLAARAFVAEIFHDLDDTANKHAAAPEANAE